MGWGQINAQERRFVLDPSLRPGDYEPHTVVVKFKPTTNRSGRTAVPSTRNNTTLRTLGVTEIGRMFPKQQPIFSQNVRLSYSGKALVDLSNIYEINLPTSQKLETAINTLLSDPSVEYAEPLYTNYQPLAVPNDPLAQPTTGDQYWIGLIKAYEAWDVHKGNANVTIGVIDYGFDITHEDLKDKIQYNTADPVDGIDNDKDGYIDNYAGWNILLSNNNLSGLEHGTRVAGCAAATPDNGLGMAGVAYGCRFMPVSGYDPATGRFSGFAGLVYLAEKGCKVINMSWGRPGVASALEQDVINYAAINHDAVLVGAAGNDNTTRYWWPASYENVISVAASGPEDLKAAWLGTGGSTYNDKVDISAPGQSIISTQSGAYFYDSGTSYSSPIVAGAAALVRSMYPNLSAAEVIQRILATADDIYSLPGNSGLIGKLGSGRLNVYRALSEPVAKSVAWNGVTVQNAQNQPYLLNSVSNNLIFNIKSIASTLSNAQFTLTDNSPFVTITNAMVGVGLVNPGDTISNRTAPFQIQVNPSTPPNTEVVFTMTVTDGSYRRSFTWRTFVNTDYLDIAVNHMHLTATSSGRLGYNQVTSFWNVGIVSNLKAQGNGISHRDQPLLFEAGLIVATSNDRVSDCVRGASASFAKNQHFVPIRNVAFQNYPLTDALAGSTFTENPFHPARIGLEIQQQTYAWRNAPNDNFVIVEYKIKNRSGARIDSLYTGIFADWEIGTRQNNQADWDATRRLGYVFNPTGTYPYAGVRLLTEQTPQYYAFDNQSEVNIFDGFTMSEKFRAISSGVSRTQTIANADDVAHLLAARINGLSDGDSAVVAFAVVAGNSISELQQTSDAARQKFVEINRSPKPVVPAVQTCRGGRVMIAPSPGQKFKFYRQQPNGTLAPLSQGSELELENILRDTTVFVTNADSLYESEPVPVRVKVFEADFQVNKDSLGIFDKDELQLTNQTVGAVQWTWDFGDGNTSNEPNPSHTYGKEGIYQLSLITENAQGCRDTLVREIRVFPGIFSPAPVIQPVTICPGDSVVLRPSNANAFRFYTSNEDLIGVGQVLNVGRIYHDTLFYVTGTDFLFESQAVAVTITVAKIKADFAVSNDTIDLSHNETLQVTDRSTGAVRWHWDFGGRATAKTKTASHAYTREGRYTVTLTAENAPSCVDTLTKQIIVIRRTNDLAEGIRVWPNPASDFLKVEKTLGLQIPTVVMRVYNSSGQEVYSNDNVPYASELDVRPLGKGIYFVTFTGNNQRFTRKIVVH